MADLFRKSSLEKLSSPEQLDKMIVITPPSFWIALSGAGVIIIAALLWSIFGRLPVNVETQGIYVTDGGVYSVYANTAGVVEEVLAREGTEVKKGDVIAVLDGDDVDKKIAEYENRIEAVKAITMDSVSDVVTADNANLMDVKNQMITVRQTLEQDQRLLEMRTEELASKRKEADRAEQTLQEVETAFYNSINIGDSTAEQLAFSESQSELSSASTYLESANSSLSSAKVNYVGLSNQYANAMNAYQALIAEKEALTNALVQKAEALEALRTANGMSGDFTPDSIEDEGNGAYDHLPAEIAQELKVASDEYLTAFRVQQEFSAANEGKEAEYQTYLAQAEGELEQARLAKDSAQEAVDKYSSQKSSANGSYEAAKNAYIAKMQSINNGQQLQSIQSNEYSLALNDFNTKQSALISLEDAVTQLEVQVELDQKNVDAQTKVIYEQFNATRSSIISQLEGELRQYEEQKEQMQIRSTADGRITNLSIVEGSAVQQGSVLAKVGQGTEDDCIVVCYAPITSGKKIQEGMEVLIYPTTVNKQEYGHMEATVESVDDYITSVENMQVQLGDDKLVEVFLQEGPVVEVTCRLRRDENTDSGYYWSSKKGAALLINEGTMMEASVVIEEKAPITMLIPFLKEKLTIKMEGEK